MKIPLFKIRNDKRDIELVSKAIKKGMNWAIGEYVSEFEKKIADYVGVKFAVVFNSGTSALHSLLLAYGITSEDEIIVPSFTFIASSNAALFVGAKPVFADIEPENLGLSPEDVEKKITKRTKAIIAVHYSGLPCKIDEISEIAKKRDIILIEDAAESLGAKVNEKKVGSFGHSSIFSFCANKIISTGEGGAAVTNSKDVYNKLKLICSHGRLESENYFHSSKFMDYVTLGYNFRMSNIIAALGISQMEKLEENINLRRKNAKFMINELKKIKELWVQKIDKKYFHTYQIFSVFVKKGKKVRDKLQKFLSENGITTKVYFYPVHKTHFYKNELKYKCFLPVTERISNEAITLPMYPTLTEKEMKYIIKKVNEFFMSNH